MIFASRMSWEGAAGLEKEKRRENRIDVDAEFGETPGRPFGETKRPEIPARRFAWGPFGT